MKVTWIGGPSFVLELGPFRIVGDPVFADRVDLDGHDVRRLSARPDVSVSGADAVLVTSLLADHFEPATVGACGGVALLPAGAAGGPGTRVLGWQESQRFEKAGAALVVTAVPGGAPDTPETKRGNGYFLRLEAGERPFTAYVTGDTRFSDDTRAIQRTYGHANLLVLHVGAERAPDGSFRSADAKDAMQIVYRMQPNAIAAVHHATFSHYTEALDPLVEKIGLTIYEKRLRVLREGDSFEKAIGPDL
jgi:N-acyl-phosphatidylethanolamine-hydrolysing phospholipase D